LRVGADAFEAAQPPALARRGVQHPGRDIERDHPRARMKPLELATGMPGAASGVHDDLRLELDVRETREEPAAHVSLQDGCTIVSAAGALEGTAHPAAIERETVGVLPSPACGRGLG
jgi:hypothetical protein